MRLSLYSLCVLLVLLCSTSVVVASLEKKCHARGFDPEQLSCDTCALLKQNEALHTACLECCQAYKTLHGQPQRFESAVLLYNSRNEEMLKFEKESLANVHHQKGSHRLEILDK
jgi:hypothetical protein